MSGWPGLSGVTEEPLQPVAPGGPGLAGPVFCTFVIYGVH
jgi:hypothetical protein